MGGDRNGMGISAFYFEMNSHRFEANLIGRQSGFAQPASRGQGDFKTAMKHCCQFDLFFRIGCLLQVVNAVANRPNLNGGQLGFDLWLLFGSDDAIHRRKNDVLSGDGFFANQLQDGELNGDGVQVDGVFVAALAPKSACGFSPGDILGTVLAGKLMNVFDAFFAKIGGECRPDANDGPFTVAVRWVSVINKRRYPRFPCGRFCQFWPAQFYQRFGGFDAVYFPHRLSGCGLDVGCFPANFSTNRVFPFHPKNVAALINRSHLLDCALLCPAMQILADIRNKITSNAKVFQAENCQIVKVACLEVVDNQWVGFWNLGVVPFLLPL